MEGLKIESMNDEVGAQDCVCKRAVISEKLIAKNVGKGDQMDVSPSSSSFSASSAIASSSAASSPSSSPSSSASSSFAAASLLLSKIEAIEKELMLARKPALGKNALGLTSATMAEFMEYTDDEWDAVVQLKTLYLNTLENDVTLQASAHELEKFMEPSFNEIYDKRAKILADIREQQSDGPLAKFWLIVLQMALPDFVTAHDTQILTHLIDIRSTICLEPYNKFTLEFVFAPNEFFSNEVLTKTYYLDIMPDLDDPFAYNGAQVLSCEGCIINWNGDYEEINNQLCSFSFFDYFNPPAVPSDTNDAKYDLTMRVLQKDYECGYYLKSCVIPKAVLFFTGDIRMDLGVASNDSNETLCDELMDSETLQIDADDNDDDDEDDVDDDDIRDNDGIGDGDADDEEIIDAKELEMNLIDSDDDDDDIDDDGDDVVPLDYEKILSGEFQKMTLSAISEE